MATKKAPLPPIGVAVSWVLWEADVLCLGKFRSDGEYDGEAREICEAFHGAKLDAEKATAFLVSIFRKWGYNIKPSPTWDNLGEAIAWLYNNEDKWVVSV